MCVCSMCSIHTYIHVHVCEELILRAVVCICDVCMCKEGRREREREGVCFLCFQSAGTYVSRAMVCICDVCV